MALESVIVEAGRCGGCIHYTYDDDYCCQQCVHVGKAVDTKKYLCWSEQPWSRRCARPSWCPLGTQSAIRWTPEIVDDKPPPQTKRANSPQAGAR